MGRGNFLTNVAWWNGVATQTILNSVAMPNVYFSRIWVDSLDLEWCDTRFRMKEKQLVGNLDMEDYTTTLPPVLLFLIQQRKFMQHYSTVISISIISDISNFGFIFQPGKTLCGRLT